ncbi:MAG: TetR family transcriptional regulator [Bacteroidota bacterium]|nr:TetR family transcriptional regulator [Bacteroidota bacterium]
MPIKERRTRQKLEMKQTILDAAKDIASADGWQNVTIRKICDRIHYTAPVVYQYFESKEMILQELRKAGIVHLSDTLRKIHDKENEPRKQLVEYGLAVWKFALEHPELYQVMFNLQGALCCEEGEVNPRGEIHGFYKEAIRKINVEANKSQKQLLFLLDYFTALIHGIISMNMVNKVKSGKEKGQTIFKESLKHFVQSIENKKEV